MKRAFIFLLFAFLHFNLFAQPRIYSVNPLVGIAGTTVTIKGNNFNTSLPKNKVFFGAQQGIITSLSQTQIIASVPFGATYQPLTVLSDSLVSYARNPFTLTYNCINNLQTDFFSNEFKFPAHTGSMAVGDFDSDGKTDIVSMDINGLDVYKNTGSDTTLSFISVQVPTYLGPFYMTSGDLNGDGKPDLIVTYQGVVNDISVYENTTQNNVISFSSPQQVTVTDFWDATKVFIKDVNMDGKPDVLVIAENGIVYLPNTSINGVISFGPRTLLFKSMAYLGGTKIYSSSVTDIDGDGNQDIISYYFATDSTISIFKNASINGILSFSDTVNITVGKGVVDLSVGDFNNDNKPDIALISQTTNKLSLLKNTSVNGKISFSFQGSLTTLATPTVITVSDINGDGKCDLLIGQQKYQVIPSTISIFKNVTNNDSVIFANRVDYKMGAGISSLAVADINLDAKPDVISANPFDGTISVFQTQTPPLLDSFSPSKRAKTGDTILINGSSLKNVTAVSFGGKPASFFSSVSSNLIKAVVGTEQPGNIIVKTIYGIDSLSGFLILKDSVAPDAPIVENFMPVRGNAGITITLTGKNFANGAANNIVYFGDVQAKILSASPTLIKVKVPNGVTYKPISVTKISNGLTGYSTNPFLVTFPDGQGINQNTFYDSSLLVSGNVFTSIIGFEYCDLNNDGKLDLIETSTAGNCLVYKNISTFHQPKFSASPDCIMGYEPTKIITTDIDGDGKRDVITLMSTGGISVFKNTSASTTITFDERHDFYAAHYIDNIAAGDIDGDGKTDIIATFDDNSFAVLKNTTVNGIISFDIQMSFKNANEQKGLAIADVNGDGKPDVAITDNSNHVAVFINSSTFLKIDFKSKISYATAAGPRTIDFADMNNDGKPDIVITNYEANNISVFRNTTDSVNNVSFAARKNASTYSSCQELVITDFDGDGFADIAVSSPNNIISIFKNKSTDTIISFSRTDYFDVLNPYKIKAADIDNDGKADLSVSNNYTNISALRNIDNEPNVSSISPETGSPKTLVTIKGNNFSNVTSVKFGNYNAESFTIQSSTTIVATLGNVSADNFIVSVSNIYGTSTINSFYSGLIISSVTPASGTVGSRVTIKGINFNNDLSKNIVFFGAVQAKHILSASDSIIIVVVPDGATYAPITVSSDSLTAFSSKPFSIKFDGDSVLNAKSFSKKINYALNHFSGTVTNITDINGDGKPDVLAGTSSNYLSVYKNISDSINVKLAPAIDFNTSSSLRNIIASDLNGDGKPDVIGCDYYNLIVLQNKSTTSNISFAVEKDFYAVSDGNGLAVGDFNDDGRPDIVAVNKSANKITVTQNIGKKGKIEFGNSKVYASGAGNFAYPLDVCVADFDRDGKKDIAVCNSGPTSNSISIFRNISTRSEIKFEAKIDIAVNQTPWAIVAGDVDNDGLVDIAIANNLNRGSVSVLKNKSTKGNILFNNRIDFAIGQNPQSLALSDINGDGRVDIVTADIGDSTAVSVLKNRSTKDKISFATDVQYAAGSSVYVSLGDLNADSRPEIVYMNYVPDSITILKNNTNQFSISGKESKADAVYNSSDAKSKVILYPNPVIDVLHIEGLNASSVSYLEIINREGKVIAAGLANSSSYNWNIKNLTTGIYYVKIKSDSEFYTMSFYKN